MRAVNVSAIASSSPDGANLSTGRAKSCPFALVSKCPSFLSWPAAAAAASLLLDSSLPRRAESVDAHPRVSTVASVSRVRTRVHTLSTPRPLSFSFSRDNFSSLRFLHTPGGPSSLADRIPISDPLNYTETPLLSMRYARLEVAF